MTFTLSHLVVVALGGALGGIFRVWLAGAVARRLGERFPWGTLAVNVTGAALIGAAAAAMLKGPGGSVVQHPALWASLVIGILGSYTTVSSFSLQTLALLQSGERARAAGNVAGSLVLCLAAVSAAFLGVGFLMGR